MSSRRQSKIKEEGFIDAKYSSGDNNIMIRKSYREENNNEVDVLSEELQMGCIVDAVKRPPNICVETCVYDEESDPEEGTSREDAEMDADEDAYSDEFEECSDGEDSVKMEPKSAKSETDNRTEQPPSSVKLSKSHSFMSSKANGSVTGKSVVSSSNYGSLSIPKTRRINMSFTNDRLREIERHNHILLNKILCARNVRRSSIPPPPPAPAPAARARPAPAACNRKRQQRQIDHDNMILLRKIQRAKSSSFSRRR